MSKKCSSVTAKQLAQEFDISERSGLQLIKDIIKDNPKIKPICRKPLTIHKIHLYHYLGMYKLFFNVIETARSEVDLY